MQKFLGIDNIVEVKSLKVSDKFSLDRLNTLAISEFDSSNPQDILKYYKNAKIVFQNFGSSKVDEFAKIYFGFTSKSLTTPDTLAIFTWNKDDVGAFLRGDECPDISILKTLNGKAKISIDGVSKDFELDLTGENIVSYDNVASAIQTALRSAGDDGFNNATCIYSSVNNGFIIGSGTTGDQSSITAIKSPDAGTDISRSLGLSDGDKIQIINGRKGMPTLSDALEMIKAINGNYYVITTINKFSNELQDLITFGEWLKNSKDRFLGIYLWDNPQLGVVGSNVTEKFLQFDGLYFDWKRAENQNAFSSAIISSLDLAKDGGYFNINFNEAPQFLEVAVSEQNAFDAMIENRVNAPYVFGEIGSYTTTYGQGLMMGSIRSANVYVSNSFLKIRMQFAISNLLMQNKTMPLRGGDSIALVLASLSPIFNQAVNNNLIAVDALTTGEKNIIVQNFKNPDDAITGIEKNGWYFEFDSYDTKKQELCFNYAYIANAPANRFVIKTYILGV